MTAKDPIQLAAEPTPPASAKLLADVAAVSRISAVPMILRVVAQTTGMRFSVIARVTDDEWVACAVHDELAFGLEPGGTLHVSTTLCSKVRDTREPVVIEHATLDPKYRDHHTPKIYGIESYISVPIFLANGDCFGTVCAIDPLPRAINQPKIIEQLKLFAELISVQLEAEQRQHVTETMKRRLASFVMSAPAAIAVLAGPSLVHELANERYARLVGRKESVGMPLRELGFPSELTEGMERVYASGERMTMTAQELLLPSFEGAPPSTAYFDWVAQPNVDDAGKVDGVMFFAVEVTEEVIARNALERRNSELDQFASVASHDLKSPLRGIGNLAQWMQDDLGAALSEEGRAHLQTMRRRVTQMNALIDGILRYARAGDPDKTLVDVAVGPLLTESIDMLAAAPTAHFTIAADMPTLRTSRASLQQVFLNLLGNALKHAGRDDVHVTVAWRDEVEYFVFSITDDGPGISAQHQEHVWEIFHTLRPSSETADSGIGLSIVRKIVEMRRGKVSIDSKLGEGTTFSFSWPKQEARGSR